MAVVRMNLNAVRKLENERHELREANKALLEDRTNWREQAAEWEKRFHSASQTTFAYKADCDKKDAALFEAGQRLDREIAACKTASDQCNKTMEERDDARKENERLAMLNRGLMESERSMQEQLRQTKTQLLYYVELTRRICGLG